MIDKIIRAEEIIKKKRMIFEFIDGKIMLDGVFL
jgi:hypothetical protein